MEMVKRKKKRLWWRRQLWRLWRRCVGEKKKGEGVSLWGFCCVKLASKKEQFVIGQRLR
ncbi:hypothetical protein HanIR_Chr06g0256651 [Helianthus annuus]|nr:hypothetical protein HanIR_Chr06g0256651 [Helianthus annuus]